MMSGATAAAGSSTDKAQKEKESCPTKRSYRWNQFHSIISEGEKLATPFQKKRRRKLISPQLGAKSFGGRATITRHRARNQSRRKTRRASSIDRQDAA